MRSFIIKAIEIGFFTLLFFGGLLLVTQTVPQFGGTGGSVVVAPSPIPAQFSPSEQAAIDRAKQYLREHAKEYGLRPDLSDLRVEYVNQRFGASNVGFRQTYRGILVANTGIGVYFAANQKEPIDVSSSYNPQIVLRPGIEAYPSGGAATLSAKLSAQDAAGRAFTATGAKSRFQAPPANADLVLWPIAKPGAPQVYTLAWDVQMITTDPYGNWGVTVDALTGEILAKGNRFVPEPTGSNPQPYRSPVPIGPTPTFIPPTPVIIIGPGATVNPLATPIPPVPPSCKGRFFSFDGGGSASPPVRLFQAGSRRLESRWGMASGESYNHTVLPKR